MSKQKNNITFFENFVVRTPLFSFNQHKDTELKVLLKDNLIREALWLASPSLFDEVTGYLDGKVTEGKRINKLKSSVYKYLSRAHTRPTPFGLFAGCGVGSWGENSEVEVGTSFYRYVRLDMHCLSKLAKSLEKDPIIRKKLIYFPNSSLYTVQNQMRYVSYVLEKDKRSYKIDGVASSTYLNKVLSEAEKGNNLEELANSLVDNEVSKSEALEYIYELVEAQLLVSELEPSAIEVDFLKKVIIVLQGVVEETNPYLLSLRQIDQILSDIEQLDTSENALPLYNKVIQLLDEMEVEYTMGKLFHVDVFRSGEQITLEQGIQNQLVETFEALSKLNTWGAHSTLEQFKTEFFKRFETAPKRLVDVLDTDLGIGYPANTRGGIHSPLLQELNLHSRYGHSQDSIAWSNYEKIMFKALNNAPKILELDKVRFPEKHTASIQPTPTQNCMFRFVSSREGKNQLCLESMGGASASALLGRFSCGNEEINNLTQKICAYEAEAYENSLVAEVCHINEARVGNITYHRPFRKNNIAYLNGRVDNNIPITEIMVQVVNDKLLLFDRQSGKTIVPRISNAHNYSSSNLPLYHFLGDYQNYHQKTGEYFDWGGLRSVFQKLPRVVYKEVIVQKAEWNLTKQDFEKLTPESFQDWIKKWELPVQFVLADGDNELFIDVEDPMAVNAFIATIEKRSRIKLVEFLIDSNSPVKDEAGRAFAHQIIAPIKMGTETSSIFNTKLHSASSIKRSAVSGSDWSYFKLYGGKKTLDTVLSDFVLPILDEHGAEWFFIRYGDPDDHLRIRIKNKPTNEAWLAPLNLLFDKLVHENVLWKVQADTYLREVERYGEQTMEHSEDLFCIDSQSIARLCSLIEGDEGEEIRWRMGCLLILQWLKAFEFNPEDHLKLLQQNSEGFRQEFGIDSKQQKKELDKLYRSHSDFLEAIFTDSFEFPEDWLPLYELLQKRLASIQSIVARMNLSDLDESKSKFFNFVSSHIHMTINRLFIGDQRKHEMVLYDFLFKHFRSVYYRFHKTKERKKATVQ